MVVQFGGRPGAQLISQTSTSSSACSRVDQRSSVGQTRRGQQIVEAAVEHVCGALVGDAQQVSGPQPVGKTDERGRAVTSQRRDHRCAKDMERDSQEV